MSKIQNLVFKTIVTSRIIGIATKKATVQTVKASQSFVQETKSTVQKAWNHQV